MDSTSSVAQRLRRRERDHLEEALGDLAAQMQKAVDDLNAQRQADKDAYDPGLESLGEEIGRFLKDLPSALQEGLDAIDKIINGAIERVVTELLGAAIGVAKAVLSKDAFEKLLGLLDEFALVADVLSEGLDCVDRWTKELGESIGLSQEAQRSLVTIFSIVGRLGSAKSILRAVRKVKGLHRPYIRKQVRKDVRKNTRRNRAGELLGPDNAPLRGKVHLGHRPEYQHAEWRKVAEELGIGQKEFNDIMNDPRKFWLEDAIENVSHLREDSALARQTALQELGEYVRNHPR